MLILKLNKKIMIGSRKINKNCRNFNYQGYYKKDMTENTTQKKEDVKDNNKPKVNYVLFDFLHNLDFCFLSKSH